MQHQNMDQHPEKQQQQQQLSVKYISEDLIRKVTKVQNLKEVTHLNLHLKGTQKIRVRIDKNRNFDILHRKLSNWMELST